uniref:Alpha-aminoadipate reductase n=1 Tax=Blastobotrys adeninivorans TaxID=409370 RepID=A0A060TAU4_BLAAD
MSWSSRLANATVATLPGDFVLPEKVTESIVKTPLPASTRSSLSTIADGAGLTPFMAAQAAYAVLMFRLTGDEDIVFCTSDEENRGRSGLYVLRASFDGQSSFTKVLDAVRENLDFASANPVSGLSDIVTNDRVYRTALVPQGSPINLGPGVEEPTDAVISLSDKELEIRYNSRLFRKARIETMVEQLFAVIEAAAEDPNVPVGTFSLITASQRDALPVPTTNLNWNKFGGAIHDIFSRNAAAHPDRDCVIETPKTKGSPSRVFSYKHIDQASNVLAHHLVNSGIVQGDIVMVYAYRGVDLVVAVMGVLKAGATFSVIDPAYPPERQNIYLSVAKPQALVVLRKAGELSDLVRDYIGKELNLKTEVPALELLDDGSLIGGSTSAGTPDVLADAQSLKEKGTGVVVGPDSNPTLSFTSGSEGIPKGVFGRHFSLTYYFPWMGERFGLSEKDKFTMLSGIAHDPIQRDMFTPLFFGAQLLVPTSDDIGTPGRLAEWMADYGATVTHLTPAMGQLLSAQATATINSLHHAFFVGDILTKRDCARLQGLAPNVAIVNMYGTTETQRSVSYFEIAPLSEDPAFLSSEKDVMPAGSGMLDVQLLVVNRNDRTQTCGVGEVGEIYVRAGGLAEGYMGLPDMTAQKFVTNWFVNADEWNKLDAQESNNEPWRQYFKGCRDRLYRTGDLGRYRPDGNVDCCGRADDQVKIRGFRIELGEIDTHLSQHKRVRENVTLVRRDKDEEPTLISYIVPHSEDNEDEPQDAAVPTPVGAAKAIAKYNALIKDIKAYLKTRLPTYAVPTVIVPLKKLPLNPNGKIDKPRLPFPDTALLADITGSVDADSDSKFTPTERKVRDLWLSLFPQKPVSVDPSDSFFDLGGHSILATQMIFELRKRLGYEVPLGLVFAEPTIAGFARELDNLRDASDPAAMANAGRQRVAEPSATPAVAAVTYGDDAIGLREQLAAEYVTRKEPLDPKAGFTVFLTGATGFLGTFIIQDLLSRKNSNVRIIAHVRAKTAEAGLDRIRNSGIAFGIWKEEFASRIEPLLGNLEDKHFGLSDADWDRLANSVDVVIHNGALVHWVFPYSKLRGPNVLATINVMDLCTVGTPKFFSFVSSTSTIDSDHYVALSDSIIARGGRGIPESDTLEGSRSDLTTGYGQSKWVSENLIRFAGTKGLVGTVIRPGYILGDSKTGASSTDDFLLRMLKGCIQLGASPDISNTINMVQVDHVARVVTACALHPSDTAGVAVAQVTSNPRLTFNEFLGALSLYGYGTKQIDYVAWRRALEDYVLSNNDNALFSLLHFVLDDLPASTKAPELDDTNVRASLKADAEWTGEDLSAGRVIDIKQVGVYLSYLIAVGFLEKPSSQGSESLPEISISKESLEKLAVAGGRTTTK